MNTRKILYLVSLLLTLTLFIPIQGSAQMFPYIEGRQPKAGSQAPIITHAFAVEKGYYGYIWKIYIEAEDPDGQMLRIASVVDEVGYGHYPTDWIYLKSQYQKQFKGYIQWNTFSSRSSYLPEWTEITVKVSVFDKAGNESNEVVFPFTFEITPEEYAYKLPPPFDQGDLPRLGYIAVDLFYPGIGGYNGSVGMH
jgi:hypothetical protein